MPAKLTSSGTVVIKDVGKNSLQDSLGVSVKLTAKQTTKGITYLFTATDSTIKNLRAVLGPQLSLAKPLRTDFCVLEGALGYDVSKQALTTALTANRKTNGKEMELKAAWAELTGHWTLAALLKPHKAHKLTATVNPHTGASTASYAWDWRTWTFTPTVALNTKVQGSRIARPSIALTLEREYVGLNFSQGSSDASSKPGTKVTTFTDSRTGQEVAVKEKPAVPAGQLPAGVDDDVKDRLKKLDAAYEAEFAKLGKRHPNGVESLSYKK
ncbi:hypothetical protein WJX73_004226 [Symbiochloris irregularis]|uniref:Uncharacterized protein n=1 Tax=Symbiochloris irregularis TaxID=706552 RepID=A0AAW1P8B9_9CHLO